MAVVRLDTRNAYFIVDPANAAERQAVKDLKIDNALRFSKRQDAEDQADRIEREAARQAWGQNIPVGG